MKYRYASKKTVLTLYLVLLLIPLLVTVGLISYISYTLPSSAAISAFEPYVGTKVYDINDNLIYEFYKQKRIILKRDEIPAMVKIAFLSIEDQNFYKHSAIDLFGIMRASLTNILKGRVIQGASTITQQLARNMYLTHERTIVRKLREMVLAYKIEFNFSKDEILQMYLNVIYLGNGAYGVGAAAKTYFDKNVDELNINEIALLAALAKGGNYYSPYTNPKAAFKRRNLVLYKMYKNGYLEAEKYRALIKEPIEVVPQKKHFNELAPYFIEEIRRRLVKDYGNDVIYTGGLNVYTTLDPNIQDLANQAVQLNLEKITEREAYKPKKLVQLGDLEKNLIRNMILEGTVKDITKNNIEVDMGMGYTGFISIKPRDWTWDVDPHKYFKKGDKITVKYMWANFDKKIMGVVWERKPFPQVAFVAMDPTTGYVNALIGGADFRESQFNRATQSKLQVGSTIKPLFYTAAIDSKKYTMASVFVDAPFVWELPGQNPPEWKPKNYNDEFRGPMTLRNALAYSINIVSAKLLKAIGPATGVEYIHKLGVTENIPAVPSLATGGVEMTPLELAKAYCAFANMGSRVRPIFIRKITDDNGNVIKENEPELQKAIPKETAYIMLSMMKGTYDVGTAAFLRKAFNLKGVVAGKSGTTNDAADLWLVALTPKHVFLSWMGFDYKESLGEHEYGSKAHGEGFAFLLNEVLKDNPNDDWVKPYGVIMKKVDPWTGKLTHDDDERGVPMYFYPGTEPTQYEEKENDTHKNSIDYSNL